MQHIFFGAVLLWAVLLDTHTGDTMKGTDDNEAMRLGDEPHDNHMMMQ